MKHNNVQQMQDYLRHITYKPNVKIEIVDVSLPKIYDEQYNLVITMEVPHRDTHEPVKIQQSIAIHMSMPMSCFEDFVFNQIQRLEIHEAKEWFKVKGVRVYEPHNKKEF